MIDVEKIKSEAIAAYPNEAVWLVTEKRGCYQVENIHSDPENFFKISSEDSLQASLEGLLQVIHSHCDVPEVPSKEDMELFERVNVPCGILTTDGEWASEILWMNEDIPPLEGRPFIHGVSDCYSVLRDYYRLKGFEVADVPRDWCWWDSEEDNYLEKLFESRGFYEVPKEEARAGDSWLALIRGPVIHHCGVLLENDLILHHPGASEPIDRSKLSIVEPIYRYLPYIQKFVRFKGFEK